MQVLEAFETFKAIRAEQDRSRGDFSKEGVEELWCWILRGGLKRGSRGGLGLRGAFRRGCNSHMSWMFC